MDRHWEHYSRPRRVQAITGVILLAVGIVALLVIYAGVWWWTLFVGIVAGILDVVFPCAMLALVVYLVWAWRKGKLASSSAGERGTLRASTSDKRIAGVCGGLAEYLRIDSMVVRIVVLLLFVGSPLLTAFLYFILALALPRF